jgi:hypothetical protein
MRRMARVSIDPSPLAESPPPYPRRCPPQPEPKPTKEELLLEVQADEKADHEKETCSICMVNKKMVLYSPCKHLATCNTCAQQILKLEESKKQCPLCRAKIEELTNIFV